MKKIATIIIVILVIFGLVYLHNHPLEAKQKAADTVGAAATFAGEHLTEDKIVDGIEKGYQIGSNLNEKFGHLIESILERLGYNSESEEQR